MAPRKPAAVRVASGSNASPVPTEYPGQDAGPNMSREHWGACVAILDGVYKARDGSRRLADIFRQTPDRSLYPDYYDAIPEPESLDNISSQLALGGYSTPEAFFKQLHLVFLNAKHYNEEGSQVWIDAKRLEDQIRADWHSRATAGPLPNPDPYYGTGKRRGRPPKDRSTASATPAPAPLPAPGDTGSSLAPSSAVPATSLPVIPGALSPFSAPSPLPSFSIATPSPSQLPAMLPTTSASTSPPLPGKQVQRRQTELDRQAVAKLDARLPRWQGPEEVIPGDPAPGGIPGSGWWGEGAPELVQATAGASHPARINGVLKALSEYRDVSGVRLSDTLAAVPAVTNIPYLSFTVPITFGTITHAVQQTRYTSLRDFDMDMARLFEKARRFYQEQSAEYGHVLALQRLYNALTSPVPLPLPPSGVPEPSPTLYAAVPAGPGNARPMHETTQDLKAGASETEVGYGVTTFRVSTKDRIFTDEARHKGVPYRMGDYVHLINPDDATKPIIGHIFKTYIPTKGSRTHHVTVCWYYRPEQIVHTADRLFFEREVFKTGHMCDHPVEDIIERVSCQFYVKYIRGRPQAPEFYPGWPSYLCHSRYNDREWITVRIKNWNSCIPDELRQSSYMQVIQYERQIDPQQVESPFLRGIKGPGFIGEPKSKPVDDDEEEDDGRRAERERPAKRETRSSQTAMQTGLPSGMQPLAIYQAQPHLPPSATASPIGTPIPAPTAAAVYTPTPSVPAPGPSRLPLPTSMPAPPMQTPYRSPLPISTPSAPLAPATPNAMPLPPTPSYSGHGNGVGNANGVNGTLGSSRTFAAAFGGTQNLDAIALRETLPPETARLFERDSRGQVLWFSGPPLAPGAVPIPHKQSHSLEYLAYLVKRKTGRKRHRGNNGVQGADDTGAGAGVGVDVDVDVDVDVGAAGVGVGVDERPRKRFTLRKGEQEFVPPSPAEDEGRGSAPKLVWDKGLTAAQVIAGLKAAIDGVAA